MKKIILAIIIVIILLVSSFTAMAGPFSERRRQNRQERIIAALTRIKERMVERRGDDPENWPSGLVRLMSYYGLLR
jgi:hypothetical protein